VNSTFILDASNYYSLSSFSSNFFYSNTMSRTIDTTANPIASTAIFVNKQERELLEAV